MSYSDVISDRAMVLSQLMTGSGKKIHVTGFTLLNDVINEALAEVAATKQGESRQVGTLYSQLSDAVIQQLGVDVLGRIQNVTFNDAVPMIKSVMEKMRQVIDPDIPVAYTTSEVEPVIYDPIWDSQFVMDLASRGRAMLPNGISTGGMIKNTQEESFADVGKLALTGLPSVDEQMAAILGRYNEVELRRLFDDVFNQGWLPDESAVSLLTNGYQRNAWIIIYMWARNLENLPPKDSAFSLENLRRNLVLLEEKACMVIASVEELRRMQSESEVLVVGIQGRKVYVNNDLYVNYLSPEVGGTVEAILGTLLMLQTTNRRQYTTAQVMAAKADLEKAWNRHVSISTTEHGEKMVSVARRQLQLIFDGIAAERVVEGKLDKTSLESVLDKIVEEVNKMPADFIRDLHRWVFDITATVFYPNSHVGKLLTCLREVGDAKEAEEKKGANKTSAEEVRVIAVINFMGDWLADSMVTL